MRQKEIFIHFFDFSSSVLVIIADLTFLALTNIVVIMGKKTQASTTTCVQFSCAILSNMLTP